MSNIFSGCSQIVVYSEEMIESRGVFDVLARKRREGFRDVIFFNYPYYPQKDPYNKLDLSKSRN